jgi:hypothetical protein
MEAEKNPSFKQLGRKALRQSMVGAALLRPPAADYGRTVRRCVSFSEE